MPSPRSGFRIDSTNLRRRLARGSAKLRADSMRAQLMEFARKVLTTAAQITPVRDAQLIRKNQETQYDHRINYIPSYHTLENPSLIVNQAGEHWIYAEGKWYRGDWHLPDEVYGAYQDLLSERERRMKTNRQAFANSRSRARYLYKRSWAQVGESLGLQIPVGDASKAESRRQPPKQPPRGYGQVRGGKDVLSLDIRNPFLETESRYKSFTGRAILATAMNRHRAEFLKSTDKAFRANVKVAYQP